jgi:hypothetical protein
MQAQRRMDARLTWPAHGMHAAPLSWRIGVDIAVGIGVDIAVGIGVDIAVGIGVDIAVGALGLD